MIAGHSTRVGTAKIMLAGRWSGLKMVTHYAKRINAKKGGMAELTQQLGWQTDNLLEDFSSND